MLRRLSLRARLVLGVIALAAVGLGAADVTTYASLRSFLIDRTDKTLQDSHMGFEPQVEHACARDDRAPPGTSPGDYVEVRNPAGGFQCSFQLPNFDHKTISAPRIPAVIDLPSTDDPEDVRYFTVPSKDGSLHYRVRAAREEHGSVILVTATPLTGVEATLRQLLWIELLVTAGVLAALAGLGLWAVRLGLRPLEAIGETAAAIAAGDLSRRVERAEPRTEVGRLGISLNTMLSQIESAFAATEASEQRLRRFVADASHELRTPLAAVRAYAELFARGADRRPADLARAMSGITRESERMSVLVDDLLLLARLDEGRPLERKPVALNEIVADAVETAAALEPDRPIDFAAEPAPVRGDRERLRQIIDNLLGNVRSHTPPQAPVSVRVLRRNGSAIVEVADSGPGLTREQAERVFERFYRADPSRSRARGGVGLGLSIVAAVAEAHGGDAAAEARPEGGAVFRITLPVADPNDQLTGLTELSQGFPTPPQFDEEDRMSSNGR